MKSNNWVEIDLMITSNNKVIAIIYNPNDFFAICSRVCDLIINKFNQTCLVAISGLLSRSFHHLNLWFVLSYVRGTVLIE